MLGLHVHKFVAPDLSVVLGYDLEGRSPYKLSKEGEPLDFTLEMVSRSNEMRNRRHEKGVYERIGIGESLMSSRTKRPRVCVW